MKVGDMVLYDGEWCKIVEIFKQSNKSLSGNLLLEDDNKIKFLIHDSQLDI